jgi:Fe-S cluster assembly protein SufD
VLNVVAGRPADFDAAPSGVRISTLAEHPDAPTLLGRLASIDDPMVALNMATLLEGIVIDVEPAVVVPAPILVLHHVGSGASFPRLIVRVGAGAQVEVVECALGGDGATLNVPVTELLVEERANLAYGALQDLGAGAWHLATIKAEVGQDATITQLTAGLGGGYDRIRTDVALVGRGASSVLRSTFLGIDTQVHDLRTVQDHRAPRTTSDLLCKGAVDDDAHSIYTGVIRVRHGAVRSDANQTNTNLLLSTEARADSVPNLDISENDVRCSHASAVGPLDEDQRYYLESRGVDPEAAERLLVRGFFRDLLDRSSLIGPAAWLRGELEGRLEARASR